MPIAIVKQQQQRPAPAPSCTAHSAKRRYHKIHEDFFMIGAYDMCNASALRIFEMRSNQRIAHLRKRYGIARDILPCEDDLWIEMPLRLMESLSLHFYSKSSYERCLAHQSREGQPPSLIELRFVRRRFIARPGYDAVMKPATALYEDIDEQGYQDSFIVVEDEQGNYTSFDGVKHSAIREGYTRISRQYLYCIEEVNAAIAELDEEPPPKPLPRWKPVTVVRAGQEQRKGGVSAQEDDNHTRADYASNESLEISATQGGTKRMVDRQSSFGNQNNTTLPTMSTVLPQPLQKVPGRLDVLRRAPWCAETIVGLAAHILAIPDRNTVDDPDEWQRNWYEPAQWLIEATKDLDPVRAWGHIERHIRGMTIGPTWHARQRSNPTPITLRHVVGYNKATRQFTGHNWHSVEVALDKEQWWPEQTLPYDGPPLEVLDYEQGYTAVDVPGQAAVIDGEIEELDRDDISEPRTDEVVAVTAQPALRRPAMSLERAQWLVERMRTEMPELIIDDLKEIAPGAWAIALATSEDSGVLVTRVRQWYAQPGEFPAIDQAVEYAQRLRSAQALIAQGDDTAQGSGDEGPMHLIGET